jgi:hypothetical protein
MAMIAQARASHYAEVIRLSKAMLSIDYTSQVAHKYLQKTYKVIGDTAKRNKYHDIEFGLIYSISLHGDAKICDQLEAVNEDGTDEVYYFDVTKLLQKSQSNMATQGSR